jgi:hypothetical protein
VVVGDGQDEEAAAKQVLQALLLPHSYIIQLNYIHHCVWYSSLLCCHLFISNQGEGFGRSESEHSLFLN